ncbi:MAG: hypothetical protein HDT33_10435 [Clostridiales bacterium]|nr:hypothetical protein [Clostridiales bacterium]
MSSSLVPMLATPIAAVIGLACFLVSGGLLVFRGKALSKGAKAALIVVLALSILYLLFVLWLVIASGAHRDPNYAPIPAPN